MGYAKRETVWVAVGPVTCVRTTDRAICVRVASLTEGNPPEEVWVPKSQLHEEENEIAERGDVGMLIVTDWIAKQKGWI